jgi:triacylglycerol lipase
VSVAAINTGNICETKYPLLLVHGAGSIDQIHWGRIPDVLNKHGARVFFGQQESWADRQLRAPYV